MSCVRATASPAGTTSGPWASGPTAPTRSSSSGSASRSGLTVANGGIAGEFSQNGLGQVEDYLALFPNARFFVVGYGTNDLGMWPEVEQTSPRIIENLDGMVRAIRGGGRYPILLNVPPANESMFSRSMAEDLRRMRDYHNERLAAYCQEGRIPLVDIASKLRDEHFGDELHPNDEGAGHRPGGLPGAGRGHRDGTLNPLTLTHDRDWAVLS